AIAGVNAVEVGFGMLALVAVVYGAILAAIDRQTARPLVKQSGGTAKPVWYVGSPILNRRGVLVLALGAATAATATALNRGSTGDNESPAPFAPTTTVPSASTPEESAVEQPIPTSSSTPLASGSAVGDTVPTQIVPTPTSDATVTPSVAATPATEPPL